MRFLGRVAIGLATLHHAGLVHRDIKPRSHVGTGVAARCGPGSLNLHVHFHAVVLDGVHFESRPGLAGFDVSPYAPPPFVHFCPDLWRQGRCTRASYRRYADELWGGYSLRRMACAKPSWRWRRGRRARRVPSGARGRGAGGKSGKDGERGAEAEPAPRDLSDVRRLRQVPWAQCLRAMCLPCKRHAGRIRPHEQHAQAGDAA